MDTPKPKPPTKPAVEKKELVHKPHLTHKPFKRSMLFDLKKKLEKGA